MNATASDTDEDIQSPASEGPGRRLRKLRESGDMELSRVAVLLHLSEEKLTALEADDYAKLPGPVFVQGYLRNYARLLGVPVQPVLNAYHAASPESTRIPELRITQVSHEVGSGHALVRLVTWGIVIGLIVLSVVWWRGYLQWPMRVPLGLDQEPEIQTESNENESQETDAVQEFPVVEVGEDGAVTLSLPQAPPAPSTETVESTSSVEDVDTGPATVKVEPADAVVDNSLPAAKPEPVEPAAEDAQQITIEYSGNSWTKIEDASGTFKIEGSIAPGTRRVLQGIPPYRMVLGNAAAVKIFVDGREFDITPYNRGNVARFTLDPERRSR